MMECERAQSDLLNGGSWRLEGDGWSAPDDSTHDICNNMNRSDNTSELNDYWLYNDGVDVALWRMHQLVPSDLTMEWR
jgi:hypothetical protein